MHIRSDVDYLIIIIILILRDARVVFDYIDATNLMKSVKGNLKNDEINNNIKQIYLTNKGRAYSISNPVQSSSKSSSRFQSSGRPDQTNQSNRGPLDGLFKSEFRDDDQLGDFDAIDFQSPQFEQSNQNESVELQKILPTTSTTTSMCRESERSKDTESGTISRKQSIASQDLDKRTNRKASTVLELKDYDKWTEENEIARSQDQFKRQQQLRKTIAKRKDHELTVESGRKKQLKNTERNRTTWFYVFMLAFVILSMVITSNYLERDSKVKNSLEYRIVFREKELRTFDLLDDNGKQVLTVHYGLKIPKDIKPIKCTKLSKEGKVRSAEIDF